MTQVGPLVRLVEQLQRLPGIGGLRFICFASPAARSMR